MRTSRKAPSREIMPINHKVVVVVTGYENPRYDMASRIVIRTGTLLLV